MIRIALAIAAVVMLLSPAEAQRSFVDLCVLSDECGQKTAVAVAAQKAADDVVISGIQAQLADTRAELAAANATIVDLKAKLLRTPNALQYADSKLAWKNNAPESDSAIVACGPSEGNYPYTLKVPVASSAVACDCDRGPTNEVLLSAVVPGPGTWTCTVKAVMGDSESPFCQPVTFKTEDPAPAPPPPPPAPAEWTFCANEDQTCAFTGAKDVRYGDDASGAFIIKTLTDGTLCANAVFGDPAFGVVKKCWTR